MAPSTTTRTDLHHYPDLLANRGAVLDALARAGTPVFLCDAATIGARYVSLVDALDAAWPRAIVAYSFKTNYLVAETGIIRRLGAWAEVVSGREYHLARELGFPGTAIVFNGPSKRKDELARAFADGALVNVNDGDELDTVLALAAAADRPVEVGMRVSCTLPRLGHSRFGFSLDDGEATEAARRMERGPGVKLAALHMHLYGDTDDPALYHEAASRLGEFARRHVSAHRETLRFVDVGGGFPAHTPRPKSRDVWNPQPIATYIDAIADGLEPAFPARDTRPTLIVEPGRYLTADGIVFVSRVTNVRRRGNTRVITSDGSISMVPLTHYSPQIIRAYTPDFEERTGPDTPTTINGSTCRENDLLYEGPFVPAERGDYLVHYAAGAYNSSLSPDFIFPSPALELL